MVFDLRAALLRKGEVESARLDDFAFRLRARSMRLLGERLGEDCLAAQIAEHEDAKILDALAVRHPDADVAALYADCLDEARTALVAERGDPTPCRLA